MKTKTRKRSEREKLVPNNVDETVQANADHQPDEVIAANAEGALDDIDEPIAVREVSADDDPAPAAGKANHKPKQAAIEADEEDEPFDEDGRADDALDFVVDVLGKMGMDCTVDLMETEPEDPPTDIRIEISGEDSGRLIGRKGQTLAALQFLANRCINRPSMRRRHVLIDADGYRTRRESALTSMATRLADQAVEEGNIITFEPMSAQDRRVVHLALAKFPGVVTKSEGRGSTRRVQIIPVRDQEDAS